MPAEVAFSAVRLAVDRDPVSCLDIRYTGSDRFDHAHELVSHRDPGDGAGDGPGTDMEVARAYRPRRNTDDRIRRFPDDGFVDIARSEPPGSVVDHGLHGDGMSVQALTPSHPGL